MPKSQGITPFQSYIFKSRYARWVPEKGRREDWGETVRRYVDFISKRIPEEFREEIAGEIEGSILRMEVMPSMRALMTAGKALEKDEVAGYNCFAGTEGFLTYHGSKTFGETVGTTQIVMSGDGEWRNAEIRSFGVQPLQEVTFKPAIEENGRSKTNLRHRVRVTLDHRWVTVNRGEVTDLNVGDFISFVGPKTELPANDEAWIAGFGFGDGTIDARGRAKVRLCGEKDMRHLGVFEKYGHSSICYPPSYSGDAVVIFHQGHMKDWKHIPVSKEACYLASWLMGYLAADGHNNEHQPGISSQDSEAIEFVKSIAPLAGYLVTGQNTSMVEETNFGHRYAPLQRLTLRRSGIFKVMSIDLLDEPEEVFCVVEPTTHSFVLANGILTGNCSYMAVDDPRAFDEAVYISMCGVGLGFSVERQYVGKLPVIAESFFDEPTVIKVRDSKIGWATAFRQLIALLYGGLVPKWDLSALRPAGSPLKTFGGRASGPDPLDRLFKFAVQLFRNAAGRRLTSLECHDLICMVADIVVSGGVRRSAMISLSNLSDDRMRNAKTGQWWIENPQRALANNSAVYTERPEMGMFLREWLSLYESRSGERGIFNREAATKHSASNGRRETKDIDFGVNPCVEIILRSKGLCNLTEAVARPGDDKKILMEKVRIATIMGTLQSTLTNFRYLRKDWQKNAEEERLLGVSLTGIMDNKLLSTNGPELASLLDDLRQHVIEVNKEWSERLGIPQSAAATCVKPSGTVALLANSSPGIHPRYGRFLLVSIREDRKNPIGQFLKQAGVPSEPEANKPDDVDVFYFPSESPSSSVLRDGITAIGQLELYLTYKKHWTEHNPSTTVYVRDHEWLDVAAWVYRHFDTIGGVSFLPYSSHIYKQAPFAEVTEAEFRERTAKMPELDWAGLAEFEKNDHTTSMKEPACGNGSCGL